MTAIARAAAAIAAVLVREGVDYAQSKAVFKAARARAGLRAAPERRGGVDRLTVEEELRFLDQAYAQDGRTGLMLQTLLETGARASELVQLRVEDVSLAERVVTIRQGKGGKRREVPIRRDLAQLLRLHVGTRRAGPAPYMLTRQRVGQVVRGVAAVAGITKRVYPPAAAHRGHAPARAGYGHHRPAAFPGARKHEHNPALRRDNGRHAAAGSTN